MPESDAGTEAAQSGVEAPPARAGVPIGKILFYSSAVLVVLFCLRVLGDPWNTHFPKVFPDSYSYTKVARTGPLHPSFIWDERPIGYPLFLWAVGRSTTLNALGLTLAYCAAFALLVAAILRAFTSRIAQSVAIFLVLLIAIQSRFALWSTQVLSESLGITTGTILLAAWLWFVSGPTPRRLTWAWVATAAWLLVRDSHVMPIALVVVPLAVLFGVLSKQPEMRKRLLVGSAVVVALCGYVYVAQDVSNRNQYPFHNNIGVRILPDDSLRQWFEDGGMPMNDTLRGRTGHVTWDDGEVFLRDPNLAEYRDWADGKGGQRFLLSLIVRQRDWRDFMGAELSNILRYNQQDYDTYGVGHRLPQRPFGVVSGPDSNGSLRVWTHLAMFGAAIAFAAGFAYRRQDRVASLVVIGAAAVIAMLAEFLLTGTARVLAPILVATAMAAYFAFTASTRESRSLLLGVLGAAGIVFCYIDLYCSYVGDSVEVARHLVGPIQRLGLVFAVCIGMGVNGLVRIVTAPVGVEPPAEPAEPEAEPAEPAEDDDAGDVREGGASESTPDPVPA